MGSALTDYQIAPDQGSVNPWQQQAAPGGHFTVTLREDVAKGQVNTLPLAPVGMTSGQGYLEYRVYLPAGGDFSKLDRADADAGARRPVGVARAVPDPHLARDRPAIHALLRADCDAGGAESFSKDAGGRPVGVLQGGIRGGHAERGHGLCPRLSHAAGTGRRGRHPRQGADVPRGRPSVPWPAANKDVRYWSMCVGLATGGLPTVMNPVPAGGTDTGCRADDQTKLDAAGEYAFVLGTEAQRATIESIAGTTFLPFSATQPGATHILMFRDAGEPELRLLARAGDPEQQPGGHRGGDGPLLPARRDLPLEHARRGRRRGLHTMTTIAPSAPAAGHHQEGHVIQERKARALPGYPMLFALLVVTVAVVGALIFGVVDVGRVGRGGALGVVVIAVLLVLGWRGLTAVNPNEAALVLFGRYAGSLKEQGFWWVNPFAYPRRASRSRSATSRRPKLKVNDHDGNPIEIAAVVVWRVVDTAEALFEVDDYEQFLKVQTEAAIRTLVTSYPYDSHATTRCRCAATRTRSARSCRPRSRAASSRPASR